MLCNISQNAMGQTPRGVPSQVQPGGGNLPGPARGGTLPGGYPAGGYPGRVSPRPGQDGGGYPVRTTEGVLTTRRAVGLLRSRRRTFLYRFIFNLKIIFFEKIRQFLQRC